MTLAPKPLCTTCSASAVWPAVVTAIESTNRLSVRAAAGEPQPSGHTARLALAYPYTPTVGDRVLVASGPGEQYIVGVLHTASRPALQLPDGLCAEVTDEGELELHDAAGQLIVRYAAGQATVQAPDGDLVLAAPHGRLVLRSSKDVCVEAQRDIRQHARGQLSLAAGPQDAQLRLQSGKTQLHSHRLEVSTQTARLATSHASLVAHAIVTTAASVVHNVEQYELSADRIVEKARHVYRDVRDLCQNRVGRLRTLVADVHTLCSRRNVMVSKDDTTIDGKRIMLG